MRLVLVLVGGGLGSAARYLAGVWIGRHFATELPWGTLSVNIVGSFLIGLLATVADEAGTIGPNARVFLVVGVLGGLTTFSSFSLEAWRLAEQHRLVSAALYVLASLVGSLAGLALGIALGRGLVR